MTVAAPLRHQTGSGVWTAADLSEPESWSLDLLPAVVDSPAPSVARGEPTSPSVPADGLGEAKGPGRVLRAGRDTDTVTVATASAAV
jgi:hypothetical protein